MNDTIYTLLSTRINNTPDSIALCYKNDGKWKSLSWAEYGKRIDSISKALIALGVKQGDKVALMGSNSIGWYTCDMGIMTVGAVTVPIYSTNSGEQMVYIINHSESRMLIVENIVFYRRIENLLSKVPNLSQVVILDDYSSPGSKLVISMNDFLKTGQNVLDAKVADVRKSVKPDMVSSYIYTSGTTGQQKAVMLTHTNCVTAARNVYLTTMSNREIIQCSYLPLSHVAERVTNLYTPLLSGGIVYLMGGYDKFLEYLKEIRPTLWAGVPRVWEKIYEGIVKYKESLSPRNIRILNWGIAAGGEYNWRKYNKKHVFLYTIIKHAIAKILVIKKILRALGLDRAVYTVTGGAPTSHEILDFFTSIGIWLQDVYGQTEGHGTTSFATKDNVRFGSAGKPYPLTEVRIADDGEILVKGDCVSPGYFKDPKLTKETFKDGWLYSGDLGRIDEEGFLWITGRKKDIIITSGGKNITPTKIESSIMSNPLIEHAVVVGDGRKYLAALLTINKEQAINVINDADGSATGIDEMVDHKVIKEMVSRHIDEVNQKFSRVEQIKKFKLMPTTFTIEGGDLTPTQKIRRVNILKKYENDINELYQD